MKPHARSGAGMMVVLALSIYMPAAAIQITDTVPANNAAEVCRDTLLRINFDEPPKLGNAGMIRIFNINDPVTPVDTVDLSLGVLQPKLFPGDAQPFNSYVVIIKGNTATVYPHAGTLAPDQTYFVTLDAGVFLDAGNAPFGGITDPNVWRFTTKSNGPANDFHLIVASDSSGDFATVQGAVDYVPAGNTNPTLISIRDGDYVEIINISAKHNVIFRGQSRTGTVVGYANNANIAIGGSTLTRMAFKVNGNDIAIDNLTITNRTPQGGSQAEALKIETAASRFIANNVTIASYQDTILANTGSSQGYFCDSLIQGDVDFIWGGGNLFFTNCEIRCLRANSVVTQPRTDAGSNGMSFVNCALTRSPTGISGCLFARPLGFGFSSVAFIRCRIDSHVQGWDPSLLVGRGGVLNQNLRWWEHGNSNLTGTATAVFNGHQIGATNGDPRLELAQNATNWLYGWQPQLLPNIVNEPTNQTIGIGQSAVFHVTATGIPAPAYQWLRYGSNLAGANGATLIISNAQGADAGPYSVVVSNAAGMVSSAPVLLNVVNHPPQPGITSIETVQNTPATIQAAKLLLAANDPEGDSFNVTSVGPVTGAGGTAILSGGLLTYTPPANQVGSDAFSYTLADVHGAATNVTVTVNVLNPSLPGHNQIGVIYTNGSAQVRFAGIPGRTYSIERATSLATNSWSKIGSVTGDGQGRLIFVDQSPPSGEAYYRTVYP